MERAGFGRSLNGEPIYISHGYFWNTNTLSWDPVTGGASPGADVNVTNFPATQPISASTLPLPTNASKETGGNLATLVGRSNTLGQKSMSGSIPVTIASDQSAILIDGSGHIQPISGTVTSNIGTTNGLVLDTTLTSGAQKTKLVDSGGTNVASVSASGAVKTDSSAITQPISVSSLPLPANAAQETGGILAEIALDTDNLNTPLSTRLAETTFTGRINTLGQKTSANSTPVVLSSDQSSIPVDASGYTIPISVASLPLPSNATKETGGNLDTIAIDLNEIALDTDKLDTNLSTRLADNTFTTRINTQGQKTMASSTPVVLSSDQSIILTNGSTVIQPVSGIVTSNQGTANSLANAWAIKQTDGTTIASIDYLGNQSVLIASRQSDSFGRLRVGQPNIIFNSKQDLASQDYLFNTSLASGGTVTYTASRASTTLAVTTANGSTAIRQSRSYCPYQPGKSLLFTGTGVIGATQTGTIKQIGLFDASNGVFFQQNGSTKNIVVRSSITGSPVDTITAQASWNIDKLDGTGASGITVDWTKVQIFVIDLQWLGSGAIRFGFNINGEIKYCHQSNNANSLSGVYMSTANLPVRYEIKNTSGVAGVASLEMICITVSAESGFDDIGFPYSATTLITPKNVGHAGVIPLIQLRPKSGTPRPAMRLKAMDVLGDGATNYWWGLYINPTITGGVAASFSSVHADSYLDYDISATGVVTGGKLIMSGVASSQNRVDAANLQTNNINLLSSDFAGTGLDTLVLAAEEVTGATNGFYASLNWVEYV